MAESLEVTDGFAFHVSHPESDLSENVGEANPCIGEDGLFIVGYRGQMPMVPGELTCVQFRSGVSNKTAADLLRTLARYIEQNGDLLAGPPVIAPFTPEGFWYPDAASDEAHG